MKIVIIDGTKNYDKQLTLCLKNIKLILNSLQIDFNHILLREQSIAPCINCRSCTQKEGEEPGRCVFNDNMIKIVEEMEESDCFIFLCPTSIFTINKIFRRFVDRLLMYAYWPLGNEKIKYRKKKTKKSLIITSNWAPYFIGKAFFNTEIVMNEACEIVGAKTVGDIYLDPLWQRGDNKNYIEKELEKLIT